MTKKVRIENADMTSYKVAVEVWDKQEGGDVLAYTIKLDSPTMVTPENLYLTSTRYFVVKEYT